MSNFIERLQKERSSLEERIQNLNKFISEPAFMELPVVQQDFLVIQLHAMQTYLTCLKARMSRL